MYTFLNEQYYIYENIPRVVCIGDIHGDLHKLLTVLKNTKIIDDKQEWIAQPKNTIVVQLGDQIDMLDRNIDRTEKFDDEDYDMQIILFMNALHKKAKEHGGSVISLIGNHELMNVMGNFSYVSPKGLTDIQKRISFFKPGGIGALNLSTRNCIVKINNILFCHAGILPNLCLKYPIKYINELMKKYLKNVILNDKERKDFSELFLSDDSILWTRKYSAEFYLKNEKKYRKNIETVLKHLNCQLMIIGHTPCERVLGLADNKVLNIDVGLSRSILNNKSTVLEIVNNRISAVIH